jgi:hypothetical protein
MEAQRSIFLFEGAEKRQCPLDSGNSLLTISRSQCDDRGLCFPLHRLHETQTSQFKHALDARWRPIAAILVAAGDTNVDDG